MSRMSKLEKRMERLEQMVMLESRSGKKLDYVKGWITDYLIDGEVVVSEIKDNAEKLGISDVMLSKAKRSLGLISVRRKKNWYWVTEE